MHVRIYNAVRRGGCKVPRKISKAVPALKLIPDTIVHNIPVGAHADPNIFRKINSRFIQVTSTLTAASKLGVALMSCIRIEKHLRCKWDAGWQQ